MATRGKAITEWLPNEILTDIIMGLSRQDQAVLCLVSKLFQRISLPALNRVVELEVRYAAEEATAFCRALRTDSTRPMAIRNLTLVIEEETRPPQEPVPTQHRLKQTAFKTPPFKDSKTWQQAPRFRLNRAMSFRLMRFLTNLGNLEHLRISHDTLKGGYALPLLEQCTFPRLLSFDICSPSTVNDDEEEGSSDSEDELELEGHHHDTCTSALPLASFMVRHQTLTRFTLRVDYESALAISRSLPLSLPNLQYYDGPASLVPSLAVGGGLREAVLLWQRTDLSNSRMEVILTALASSTRPDIGFVCQNNYRVHKDFMGVVEYLSRHIPQTKTLRVSCLSSWPVEEPAHSLADVLLRFTGLLYIDLQDSFYVEEGQLTLMDTCPTLEGFCIGLMVQRKTDIGTWERCSYKDFLVLAGITEG
ncbi:hypothetical protein C8R43DRAFT_1027651 [Mycena crocata]|nr:hypothetical protein C8R43DRAFT_1027651 [Mycena crocata]